MNCPSCDKPAVLVVGLDRYVHRDGTDNRACWVRLTRGAA